MDASRINLLLEETPDAIIAISPDGKARHWNRAAENRTNA
jgi:PAS domain-containing protein